MELKIKDFQTPAPIEFNFEELKQELAEKAKEYETLVYTDDQIKAAKADRAKLNNLKKVLNDERIRREREYMVPFQEFKDKVNQIIAIIDRPVYLIDKQVKEYEKLKKDEKKKEVVEIWEGMEHPDWLELERIFDEKWLNASVSKKAVTDDLKAKLDGIAKDIATLSNLPEFGFEATEVYKRSLDINVALFEGQRLAEIQKRKAEKLKAEQEAAKALEVPKQDAVPEDFMNKPTDPNEPQSWISFRALLTIYQAKALKEFFEENGISYERL